MNLPDQTPLVERIKGELVARGVNLNGPCGAFEITKRVAWALRDSGCGLHFNADHNNCGGFGVDSLIWKDGTWVDCLINAENENRPAWQVHDNGDVSRWRAPFDPGDAAPAPAPVPPPSPEPDPDDPVAAAILLLLPVGEAIVEALHARNDLLIEQNAMIERHHKEGTLTRVRLP